MSVGNRRRKRTKAMNTTIANLRGAKEAQHPVAAERRRAGANLERVTGRATKERATGAANVEEDVAVEVEGVAEEVGGEEITHLVEL